MKAGNSKDKVQLCRRPAGTCVVAALPSSDWLASAGRGTPQIQADPEKSLLVSPSPEVFAFKVPQECVQICSKPRKPYYT